MWRYFGKWNSAYNRFTTNFTSPKIKVKAVAPGKEPDNEIQCILHCVDQKDMVHSGKGSVSYGDGGQKISRVSLLLNWRSYQRGQLRRSCEDFSILI